MRRISTAFCILLSFLFLGIFLPEPKAEAQNSVPEGYVGITDRAGLEQITSTPDGKYILMNDIDLSASPWSALCSEDYPFTGVFDGNGYTLYGMDVTHSTKACGLFSYICGGTVRALTLSGTSCGPIAGLVAGKVSRGVISDCTVSGTVTSSFFGGGIVGQICGNGVTISECSSSAVLSGTASESGELFLGGICGAVYGTGQVLTQCDFVGKLQPSGSIFSAGGIAGLLDGGSEGVITLQGTLSQGELTLSSFHAANVGGIVGRIGGALENATAGSGSITVKKSSFSGRWSTTDCSGVLSLGGIVGRAEAVSGSISVTQCTSSGNLTATGHPNFQYSDGYRCVSCSASLGNVVSENGGTVAAQQNLDVTYTAFVGGILGAGNTDGGILHLSQCAFSGSLSGTGSPLMLGGIVGLNQVDSGTATIEDCVSAGALRDATPVHGEIASVHGGIVGFHGGGGTATLRRCFSSCELSVDYPLCDGAVVGLVSAYNGTDYTTPNPGVTVSSCYFWTGVRDAYGIPLSGEAVSDANTYVGFDFTALWQIHPLSGMPDLREASLTVSTPLKGDVDGNGKMTRYDAVLLARHLTGNAPLTDAQKQRADYNGDGILNSLDTTLILRNLAE